MHISQEQHRTDHQYGGKARRRNMYAVLAGWQGIFCGILVCGLLSGSVWLPLLLAAAQGCDPYLKSPAEDPYKYRQRGDRCEGIYIREVGSSVLFLASFTEIFEPFDASTLKELQVTWTAPAQTGIHLRAHALRHSLYYRMDTDRPPRGGQYAWPTDLLAALKLAKKDIGVVGWMTHSMGREQRDVYIPLRIQQHSEALQSPSKYQVILVPGVELAEIFVTLAPVDANGRLGTPLQDGIPLGYGYYPAERSIPIELSKPEAPGIYALEFGATLQRGGSSTLQVWFYQASR